MPRIDALPDDQLDPATDAAFQSFAAEGRKPILLYRVLAHAPTILAPFHDLGAAIRYRTELDRALAELVILRIAHLVASDYEWHHHRGMALRAGVTAEQVAAVESWQDAGALFDARERAALRLADGVHRLSVTDGEFAEAQECLGTRQTVEAIAVVAHYEATARILQALDVELEPEYSPR